MIIMVCRWDEDVIHYNCNLTGELVTDNPVLDTYSMQLLWKLFEDWFLARFKKQLLFRMLCIPLCPFKYPVWERIYMCYFMKTMSRGQHPVQEFAMICNYFWKWMLRELLMGRQYPPNNEEVKQFDFNKTPLENGHDIEIGSDRVWDMDLYQWS